MTPPVLTEGVGYRYRSGRVGLEPTTLRVGAGEIVAALGPNGSGKSTLLRLLATDTRPTAGTLTLLGEDPWSGSPRRLRRRIGYAPDEPAHAGALTGEESARFFAALRGARGATRDRVQAGPPTDRDGIPDLLARFGLAEAADVPVAEYSFGMRRKLLLVETFVAEPAIVLLDEPTIGLDPEGTDALGRELRSRAAGGAAVVVATNDTVQVPRWADRVLFLHRGAVVADAPLPTLLERLRGKTRIEIELDGDAEAGGAGADGPSAPDPWALLARDPIEGVASVGNVPTAEDPSSTSGARRALVLESSAGSAPLPEIVSRLVGGGVTITRLSVREPDLGDLFRSLTGESLDP